MAKKKVEEQKAISYATKDKQIKKWLNNQPEKTASLSFLIKLAIKQFGYKNLMEISQNIALKYMNIIDSDPEENGNVPSNGNKTLPEEVEKNISDTETKTEESTKKDDNDSSNSSTKEEKAETKPVKKHSLLNENTLS
ncbi:MAG: hypothetical protein HDS11_04295 [Bacteroides sp.]|nr:hypothetical protein [Bacteroides sp.]